jgi:ABC transporter with metal-binding/Fe-S-binding domain ATP-binding protein
MKTSKNAAVLFTGGKDSCLALLKAKKKGYNIQMLLTVIPSSYDSYMFHKPSIPLLKAQSKALGIPLLIQKSISEKEKEIDDLEKLIDKVKSKIQALVIGGIASSYQGERIKKISEKKKIELFAPLWGYSTENLWNELIKNKFSVIITKIACQGLPKELLGKIINEAKLKELLFLSSKHGFSIDFEGGDAETAVLDCPLFRNKIDICYCIKSEGAYRHFLIIKKTKFIGK